MYALRGYLNRISPHTAPTTIRSICSTIDPNPSEVQIVRALRSGDYDRGVLLFCKRNPKMRSNALHEAMILACAQVPDAKAAQMVLHVMPQPTLSAVSHVISAQCRERNVSAAIQLLNQLPKWKLPLDERIVTPVVRAAAKQGAMYRQAINKLIKNSVPPPPAHNGLTFSSSAGFFVEGGGDAQQWLKQVKESVSKPIRRMNRITVAKSMAAEKKLLDARGDLSAVSNIWNEISKDNNLSKHVGILAAAVSAFAASGKKGGVKAVNVLMNWITYNMYDLQTGRLNSLHTENPSVMALLLTSTTKALAAATRTDPYLALSAYDSLMELQLPGFENSLPLTGAYFKILQHTNLSLTETRQRIEQARAQHIQLDEQAFSMALGAILRCKARVVDKLEEGRLWVDIMKSAGIPLTIQTYNLFAGQLRYCNNPQLVTQHLSDMKSSGIIPTPVTYGLIFSCCVIPGDYNSTSRKNAIEVSTWVRVLKAMEEHMEQFGVDHTCNSRLSLARAYAHLGCTQQAMKEFNQYLVQARSGLFEEPVSAFKIEDAYNQMMFNFANCRECSSDGPHQTIEIYEQSKLENITFSGRMLDSLLAACVRTGQSQRALDFVKDGIILSNDCQLSESGIKHMLHAMSEVKKHDYWEAVRELLLSNKHLLTNPDLISSIHQLVISFARAQRRDLCNELMSIAGIEVSDLDFVLRGRDFLRFRTRNHRNCTSNTETSLLPGHLRERKLYDGKFQGSFKQDREGGRARSFHDEPLLPVT